MANLFILPHFIGDTIIISGVVDAFKNEPSVIVTNSVVASLVEDFPNVEKILIVNKQPWKRHWFEIWRQVKGREWDTLIDFKGSALPYLINAKDKRYWSKGDGSLSKVAHASHLLGFDKALPPTLWISDERMAIAQKKLRGRPTLAVAPIANWVGKEWPIERYIELLKLFCKTYPDAQVAVFAAPHEREKAISVVNSLLKDQYINTFDGGLMETAALIKVSRLFLGNDSGLMHMSAAAGTPTIGLFGPSNEKIYGPYSDQTPSQHLTIRGDPFVKHIKQAREDTNCYMTSLTVEKVWEGVKDLWEKAVVSEQSKTQTSPSAPLKQTR